MARVDGEASARGRAASASGETWNVKFRDLRPSKIVIHLNRIFVAGLDRLSNSRVSHCHKQPRTGQKMKIRNVGLNAALVAASLTLASVSYAASTTPTGNNGATGSTGVTDNDSTAAKPEVVLPSGANAQPGGGDTMPTSNVGTDNPSRKQNAGPVTDAPKP